MILQYKTRVGLLDALFVESKELEASIKKSL